ALPISQAEVTGRAPAPRVGGRPVSRGHQPAGPGIRAPGAAGALKGSARLALHPAQAVVQAAGVGDQLVVRSALHDRALVQHQDLVRIADGADRKSTRLNSSHVKISYAVFCLKKKMTEWQALACQPPVRIAAPLLQQRD